MDARTSQSARHLRRGSGAPDGASRASGTSPRRERSVGAGGAIVFALFLLVMASPGLIWVCERSGVELPGWLTAADARNLSGGGGGADVGAALSLEKFRDGELQSAIETEIADHYPLKALAMFGHAQTEEMAIEASNLLFRFPMYESYYGSGLVYYPAQDAIVQLPQEGYDDTSGWSEFARRLADFARAHPEKRFVVYLVAEWYDDGINPLYELTSTAYEVHAADARFAAELDGIPNVEVLYQDYQSPEQYYENHFRADHHQTIRGALGTYGRLAEVLGLQAIGEQELWQLDDPYMGSYARSALKDIEEPATDLVEDFDTLTLYTDGQARAASTHDDYYGADADRRRTDFYGLYYEYAPSRVTGGTGDANGLLVCDSHGAVMFRLLGSAYRNLYISHAFYYAARNDIPLRDLLAQDDVQDVIFLANLVDYKTFCERNPDFFSE